MSFQQGLSGLNAASKALDTIGNNVANSGTVGFKSATTEFADVFAASLAGAGSAPIGLGAKVATVAQQFTQGNITVDQQSAGRGDQRRRFLPPAERHRRSGLFAQRPVPSSTRMATSSMPGGQQLMGYAADVERHRQSAADALAPVRSRRPVPTAAPQATGTSTAGHRGRRPNVNLDSAGGGTDRRRLQSDANAKTYNKSTAVTVYDSLGNPHIYTMYFVKSATVTNSWNVYADGIQSGRRLADLQRSGWRRPADHDCLQPDGSIASGGTPTAAITAAPTGLRRRRRTPCRSRSISPAPRSTAPCSR